MIDIAGAQNSHFAKPDRIRYDSQSLIIDGKPIFIFSGSFHYFRCPKEMWRYRFQKIKEAGFNTVETYIPWNRHETHKPTDSNDFSGIDLKEFGEWLTMAESFGLYIIARPGPFICAEYDRGGYPGWLTTLMPEKTTQWMWLRSDDPTYLVWAAHWMKAFCWFAASHQVTRKAPGTGGIILLQVENEFSHVYFPSNAKIASLTLLIKVALAHGIEVPMIACETPEISESHDTLLRNNLVETRNFYPNYDVVNQVKPALDTLRKLQPFAPSMTTELQGGWFPFIWQPQTFKTSEDYYPKGVSPDQIQNLTLYCIQNGQTLLNYYMLFGGTNYDGSESKDMQTSYDYAAPIREDGGTGEKYQRLKAIGEMLAVHGSYLVSSTIDSSADMMSGNTDVGLALRETKEGRKYIFIRNNDPSKSYAGKASIVKKDWRFSFDYNLDPFESKVLYLPPFATNLAQGEWLPRRLSPVSRPIYSPLAIKIKKVSYVNESMPARWKQMKLGQSLLDLGIYDNRYVYYKAGFNLKKGEVIKQGQLLRVTFPWLQVGSLGAQNLGSADDVSIIINKKNLLHKMGGLPGDYIIPAGTLHEGINIVYAVYENAGYAKEFVYMEKEAGIMNIRILGSSLAELPLKDWKFKEVIQTAQPDSQPEISADYDDSGWSHLKLINKEPSFVHFLRRGIFRTEIRLSENDIKSGRTALFISQLGDLAWIYINGKRVAVSRSRLISRTFDFKNLLHPGSNIIAIVTDNYDLYASGGIATCKLTYPENKGVLPVSLFYAAEKPDTIILNNWSKHLLSKRALLRWSRMVFRLPSLKGIKVSWLLNLTTNSNCVIFFNGHQIGRYWQKGMQHDFYLPGCWFNKQGKDNVILLRMKNGTINSVINMASIIPYSTYATYEIATTIH